MPSRFTLPTLIGLAAIATSGPLEAQAQASDTPTPAAVHVDADGTVRAAGFAVPVSRYASPQLREVQVVRLKAVTPPTDKLPEISVMRAGYDKVSREVTEGWRKRWPVSITPLLVGGVQTDDVRPESGIAPENAHRVLINLHGGGFFLGGRSGGWSEAAPVAGRGRIRVVTVDYRLGPENAFPAASEDVGKVYAALLKQYPAKNIGIYGCSAGGALVAQSLVWLQTRSLPRPGAAGIFCSGAMPGFWSGGDSAEFGRVLNGMPQAQPEKADRSADFYLKGRDMNGPLVAPALFPQVLAKFPPTLILTGTRDVAMSNALVTHSRLVAAGAQSQLEVQEGMGHGEFNTAYGTPEALAAMDLIWHFFDSHLGKR